MVQRQEEEEEEIQTKPLAEQITPLVQRQGEEEEEEEPVQPKLETNTENSIQRQEDEKEEEEPLQTKSGTGQTAEVPPNLASRVQSLRTGGQPLPKSTRAFLEPRFGVDFSKVRVHCDARSAATARALNAQAFTFGRDVVFGVGQYAPRTTEGNTLLAHELTHVIQQTRSLLNQNIQRKVKRPAKVSAITFHCSKADKKNIDAAIKKAEIWRSKVLKWFSTLLKSIKNKAHIVTFGRIVEKTIFDKLKLIERDFRISTIVKGKGGKFPQKPNFYLNRNDYVKLGEAVEKIRNYFLNLKLKGIKYKCDKRDSCLEYKKDCRLGDASPGSMEFTIFTMFFIPAQDIGRISTVIHEAFHANFSNFKSDSYFGKSDYPGPSPLFNADSYTTFARTIVNGEGARKNFRFPDLKKTLQSVIEHIK